MSLRKGCINGAMLCEEVVGYMLSTYQGRFTLAEHAPIQELILHDDHAELRSGTYTVETDRVVLCTNGFSKFKITNAGGPDIDSVFHHQLHGFVGYMAAYIEELNQQPNALAYYGPRTKKSKHTKKGVDVPAENEYYDDPYFYLTRRPYELEKNERHNLVCLGGPEAYLVDTSIYERRGEYDQRIAESMDAFLKHNYRHTPKDNLKFKFTWHGLMGFTPNGIRLIGFEPLNPVLMYNLGCNGVGILPSIYGATRIADLLNGIPVPPTIFDPRRCGDKTC
jgi:glycine/D-amino acid oxidase-like deaminating enzyme